MSLSKVVGKDLIVTTIVVKLNGVGIVISAMIPEPVRAGIEPLASVYKSSTFVSVIA